MKFKKKLIILLFWFIVITIGVIAIKRFYKKEAKKYNILLVVVDTLRADHLGSYGYHRKTSPHIDKIAQEGMFFTNAQSVSPWTKPAVTSIFTGYYPYAVYERIVGETLYKAHRKAIPKGFETLAEILEKNDYYTIALIDNGTIIPKYNFDQGFSSFVLMLENDSTLIKSGKKYYGTKSDAVLENFKEQLSQYEKSQKSNFFIYVHLIYPHRPYWPPERYRYMFEEKSKRSILKARIDNYDGEIRYTDELIGQLYEYLLNNKILDNTYFIITSDHGEGFNEHGLLKHGNSHYQELLQIPLIIRPAGNKPKQRRVNDIVSNVDIFPTVLHLAGFKNHLQGDGKCLLHYGAPNNQANINRMVFSEDCHEECEDAIALMTDDYKAIVFPPSNKQKRFEFYHKADLSEKKNLGPVLDEKFKQLIKSKVTKHLKRNKKIRSQYEQQLIEEDDEILESLKALGYLH